MRRIMTALLLGGVLVLVVRAGESESKTAKLSPNPGTYVVEVEAGGYTRTATVHVPRSYSLRTPPPLVLALHGAGGNSKHMLEHNGWAEKADEAGFLVVAPEGLPAFAHRQANFLVNPRLWNSGQLKQRSPRAKIDDVQFVDRLLDKLAKVVPYDSSRVYCTGHSNGGGMTFRLAAERSERITAVATVAGQIAIESAKLKRPVPTLFIYGEEDPVLPIHGGETKLPWGTRRTAAVSTYLEKWAKLIDCSTQPVAVSDENGVREVRYRAQQNGPDLRVVYISDHGHPWPGSKRALPVRMVGPDAKKVDATDMIWSYFNEVGKTR